MAQQPNTEKRTRYALITGASSGIGKACSEALIQHNKELESIRYVVLGVARSKDKLANMEKELNKDCKDNNVNFIGIAFDLCEIDKFDQLWELINKYTKYVSILINNAGLSYGGTGLISLSSKEIMTMMNVNVIALTLLCQEGLKRMIDKNNMPSGEQGFIINIGSVVSRVVPSGSSGFYSATKHFVLALTEGLRKEIAEKGDSLKQCIHIGMINPGIVNTEFFNTRFDDKSKGKEFVNEKPHLLPSDVANAMILMIKQEKRSNICEILIRPRLQHI